jgi:hypothetical protein
MPQEDDAVRARSARGRRCSPAATGGRGCGDHRSGAAGGGRVGGGHAAGSDLEPACAPRRGGRPGVGIGGKRRGLADGPGRQATGFAWRCWLPRPRSAAAWSRAPTSTRGSCRSTCPRQQPGLATASRPALWAAGRAHQRRSDADLKAQVHVACRRPAPNTPILQRHLVQDDDHIGCRNPEAAQVRHHRPVEPTLSVK